MSYNAYVLYLLDADKDWCEVDCSFNEDALDEVAYRIATNNPERYPSGSYRIDTVGFVTEQRGDVRNAEDDDF